ncbi:MAG: Trypsin-like peptidase domain [Candidatus Parcubacteria bacterium]|jgi:S1-C subfamily serine protease
MNARNAGLFIALITLFSGCVHDAAAAVTTTHPQDVKKDPVHAIDAPKLRLAPFGFTVTIKEPVEHICGDYARDTPQCDAIIRHAMDAISSTAYVAAAYYEVDKGELIKTGTGVAVELDGITYLMTDQHVISGAEHVIMRHRNLSFNGDQIDTEVEVEPMRVVAEIPEMDVALLLPTHIETPMPPPMRVRTTPLMPGEKLSQFGKTSLILHGAALDRYGTYSGTVRSFRASMSCDHGDSGGPVVDEDGRLVGLVLGVLPNEELGQDPLSASYAWRGLMALRSILKHEPPKEQAAPPDQLK